MSNPWDFDNHYIEVSDKEYRRTKSCMFAMGIGLGVLLGVAACYVAGVYFV